MTGRCQKRAPTTPLPAGLPLETARTHPRYRYLLEPGGQCEHDAGHEDEPHRCGQLVWHDPPLLIVGGRPFDG